MSVTEASFMEGADARRRERMAVLARADGQMLRRLWRSIASPEPEHEFVRGPESGAVTVRGRMGGAGAAFNLGEATVTRATVRLGNGAVGHGAMLGRDREKVRIAALVDALALDPQTERRIEAELIAPIRTSLLAADDKVRTETAATRVNFFTMTRGED